MQLIQIQYTKIFDSFAVNAIDKYIWDSTYLEYKMQIQNYIEHKDELQYTKLIKINKKIIDVNFLISHVIGNYMQHLQNLVPNIVNNNNEMFLPYHNFEFKILESHFENKEMHKVAIIFNTCPIEYVQSFGSQILVNVNAVEHLMPIPPMLQIKLINDNAE